MTPRHFNVLFLCSGNATRSIMAEAIMNRKGFPNFTGYSAGSRPTGHVSPHALKQIADAGIPVEGLRSKSWDESPGRRRSTSCLPCATRRWGSRAPHGQVNR